MDWILTVTKDQGHHGPESDDNKRVFRARGVLGGARGVMVIVARIGHRDTSSNPGLIAFHIALIPLGNHIILPPAIGK